MNFEIQRFADTDFLKDNLVGFVPHVLAKEIIKQVTRGSSILRLSQVQILESDNKTFPVMLQGPGAYWTEEASRIQTSTASWDFPEIQAKKIAVIVPVTREKMQDTTINVFSELQPYIAESFHTAIDVACLFGVNSPFAKNIYDAAYNRGQVIVVGTNDTSGKEHLDLDISDTMALVEKNGFDVNGFAADIAFKNSLRKLRDANGNQLYVPNVDQNTLYALPIEFSRSSVWDETKAACICGDWKYAIVGVRSQIEYTLLDQATLHTVTMADGRPLSLAEQDMVAIRATMRLGFLPVKEEAFAVLLPRGAALPSSNTSSSTTSSTTTSGTTTSGTDVSSGTTP